MVNFLLSSLIPEPDSAWLRSSSRLLHWADPERYSRSNGPAVKRNVWMDVLSSYGSFRE